MRQFTLTIAMLFSPLLMSAQNAAPAKPNLELRLQPGKLVNGVPELFTFVFVNISDHNVRMPQPSNCGNADIGTVILKLELKPPPHSGWGGGCGEGTSDMPAMRYQAKDWKVLKPGESLSISFRRTNLFSDQQEPGVYDFWAEYTPPRIPTDDQRILTEEGIDFPRTRLVSPHLSFTRKP